MSNKEKSTKREDELPSTLPPYQPSEEVKQASKTISAKKSAKFATQAMRLFNLA